MISPVLPEDGATTDLPTATGGPLADPPATASTATPETAGGEFSKVPAAPPSVSTANEPAPGGYLHLRVLADTLDDIMRTRIAVSNRVERAAIEGFAVEQHLAGLVDTETKLRLALRRQFRVAAPAIREWTLATVGLGEPLMARLLGAVGDPLIAQPYVWEPDPGPDHVCSPNCGGARHLVALEPYQRTPRQFLSYCGWGDPARRRRVGMSAGDAAALGNQRAKPLAYVMAEGCIKQAGGKPENRTTAEQFPVSPTIGGDPDNRSAAELAAGDPHGSLSEENPTADEFTADCHLPTGGDPEVLSPAPRGPGRRRSPYRDVYDQGRVTYAERDWTLGHQHQAAIRLTVKAILLDLWRVSAGLEPRWPQQ